MKTPFDSDLYVFRDLPKTTIPFNSLDIAPFTLERQFDEDQVKLQGLPYRVALLYAQTGNMNYVAKELEKETGKLLKHMQVKRILMQFCRDVLRLPEKKRGRPRTIDVDINESINTEESKGDEVPKGGEVPNGESKM
jgi:hypothetical protein